MTIKEIAKLAGVSPSTVSKIMNGKDEGIQPSTRERVLKLAKEYNYAPYSFVRKERTPKTYLIGVLLNRLFGADLFTRALIRSAREYGYYVIVCASHGDAEEEQKILSYFGSGTVDGILWEPVCEESAGLLGALPCVRISDYDQCPELCIDYTHIGRQLTEHIIGYGHSRIVFLSDAPSRESGMLFTGFQQSMLTHQLPCQGQIRCQDDSFWDLLVGDAYTAALCVNIPTALALWRRLEQFRYRVPEDFSIAALADGKQSIPEPHRISCLIPPLQDYAGFLCQRLIQKVERLPITHTSFITRLPAVTGGSVDIPRHLRDKHILVVGSVHMDINLNVTELPQTGKTVVAGNCVMVPGGKGLNQAVGVSKLGKEVFLIAKVGKDLEGSLVHETLKKHRVHQRGVSHDSREKTGKAVMHILENGESSISIYSGANASLAPEDIDLNAQLFENAGYCLLQTELPLPVAEYIYQTASEHRVKVILKPAATQNISDKLLSGLEIFIPNEKELQMLSPHLPSLEERAAYFLEKGVRNVIVTMAERGCYFTDGVHCAYFPAADFSPVDTTGGSDAFIAALAVYLADGMDIPEAIRFATCAAGFCISRNGVVPALIDKASLESYRKQHSV